MQNRDDLGAERRGTSIRQRLLELRLQLQERPTADSTHIQPRRENGRDWPVSYSQERLWFLNHLGLASEAYNVPVAVRLTGELDPLALEWSFAQVVRRHEALRTRFHLNQGTPRQIVDPPPSRFTLLRADISSSNGANENRALREEIQRALRHRFVLSDGPLLRATLASLSEAEHVLIIILHHIVADGWSIGILLRELSALYLSCVRKTASELPELSIQYPDFAQWQRESTVDHALDEQLNYWRDRLAGAPPQLHLPTDRPRPSIESFQGAVCRFQLQPKLVRQLEALARNEGATLFMALLSAYQLLLSHWSGQQDIVVGTPVAGRKHLQVEPLIGFFVNTLALRTDLSHIASFRDLLRAVKDTTLGAYANQDLPFERLVMDLRPERNLSHQPIFQVMLALHNFPDEPVSLPGLRWERMDVDYVKAHFDLTLYLRAVDGGLIGELEYATDLFDASTMSRAAERFKVLIQSVVANPDLDIRKIPALGEAEAKDILSWNDTDVALESSRLCVHELVENQVVQTPAAIAVVHQGRKMTYVELDERADRLARRLRNRGVCRGHIVGICLQRSPEMIIGLLAILKAGAAYLPLDPNYPAERLDHMLRDARPTVVLTHSELARSLPSSSAQLIHVDEVVATSSRAAEEDSLQRGDLEVTPNDLVYVIYTSGSTGLPKGTAMEHRSVVNLIEWQKGMFETSPGIRVLQFAALSFDVCFQETFTTLATGGTLVLLDEWIRRDPSALTDFLSEHQIQRVFLPPMVLQSIAEECERRGSAPISLSDVITAGEQLRISPEIVGLFLRLKACRLHNHYGPTETHVVTAWTLSGNPQEWPVLPPIGRPIANTKLYVLDASFQPVPIGAIGELYIGGLGVARGYLNKPELTAQRFIRDPIDPPRPERLYRTGDLVRWRQDGVLEYVGRNDGQVKIRGYRVELGEIEAQLGKHQNAREVAVIAREDSSGARRLIAYIVPREAVGPTAEELRRHLRALLPEFMIPTAFVLLEKFPLNPNGKLDRHVLPAPEPVAPLSTASEPLQGPVEQAVAAIWSQQLGLGMVGRHRSFFDLGGHSILAVKVIAKLNAHFGTHLRVTDLYKSPTLSELSSLISGQRMDDPFVDLASEAVIEQVAPSHVWTEAAENGIFLTGATGFVGRFLLDQLLKQTNSPVHCLVRAGSDEEATRRVRETLRAWRLGSSAHEHRIIGVSGDLNQPRFGIQDARFKELCRRTATIYHCGVSMNHLETYAMAKAANVESAKVLLHMAEAGSPKLINYISTLGIFRAGPNTGSRVVDERTPIDDERHRHSQGYLASKWVSEKIFQLADARGFSCNIFRLGLIWADSQEGRYDELQREHRLIHTALLMGRGIESYRCHSPPTPVDYVARAIVALAIQHRSGAGTFHLSSSSAADRIFERLNALRATSLPLLPFYEWVQEVKWHYDAGRTLPIVPLVQNTFSMSESLFYEDLEATLANCARVDCSRTHAALKCLGIEPPELTDNLLRLTVEEMISRDPQQPTLKLGAHFGNNDPGEPTDWIGTDCRPRAMPLMQVRDAEGTPWMKGGAK